MGMLLSATAQNQINSNNVMRVMSQPKLQSNSGKVKPSNQVQEKGATVWTNDFSNSGDWTMTNTSSPNQN